MSDRSDEGRNIRADSTLATAAADQPMSHWIGPVLVALIGAFMSILDSSIVNVALPTIMNVFGVDTSGVEWVATAYLLALGVVMPFAGWLGDLLGFKRLYMISMAVFVGGSLLCAGSWNINSLTLARVLQAIGGGMIMPTMMSMVYRIVPRNKIGTAMGVFGIALLVAPAIGPTLGGYLVEYVDWRWIFTINLPVGVVGIILAWIVLPEFASAHPGKLDVAGAVTSAAALFALLLALSKGADWGWGAEPTVMLFFVALVGFVLFIYIELTAERPLLDLKVFKYPGFTMANLVIVVTTIGMYAGLFYLPLFLQNIRGLGAMQTGLLLMPGALVSGIMMPVVGRLYDKIGPRPLVIAGIILLAVTTFLFHNLSVATATSTVVFWVMLRGVVMPLANMPAQTSAMADIPNPLIGRASAMTNIIGRVASSFGIAVLTSILTSRQALYGVVYSSLLTTGNSALSSTVARLSTLGGARGSSFAFAFIAGQIGTQSYVSAIDDVFVITSIFTIIALIPALFLKRPISATTGRAPTE